MNHTKDHAQSRERAAPPLWLADATRIRRLAEAERMERWLEDNPAPDSLLGWCRRATAARISAWRAA